MKKSKSWIHVCVHFLLFITLGVHSDRLDVNPVTDDISKLSLLRQNIPRDYIIPVLYIPREEAGMCWVKLNVFFLEKSLQDLAAKFGNISSNKNDIKIFVEILQELRLPMKGLEPDFLRIFKVLLSNSSPDFLKESFMYDFECHYREEGWHTDRYFDFVKDFLTAAQNKEDSNDCDPPPCPTSSYPQTTQDYSQGSSTTSRNGQECSTNCTKSEKMESLLPEVVQQSLFSLLLIPLLAIVFLLVWKARSRRNQEDAQQNPAEDGLIRGTEGTAPPLDAEKSKKNKPSVIEIV